jgi:streptogramin lyase
VRIGGGHRHAGGDAVYYDVVPGAGPHDVAAAPVAGGLVYYTAQEAGKLGILNPATAKVEEIALGQVMVPARP